MVGRNCHAPLPADLLGDPGCRCSRENDPQVLPQNCPPLDHLEGTESGDWAEIRRLHRAEGVPIKEIARRLGVARNTVRAALISDRPPVFERAPRGHVADKYEPQMRALLQE